ncbi:MAG TPA: hypothetical protein VNL35_10120 [Chloroflexota bacterium]|nr:hypothetical protein [Chloroflexota bacterium]
MPSISTKRFDSIGSDKQLIHCGSCTLDSVRLMVNRLPVLPAGEHLELWLWDAASANADPAVIYTSVGYPYARDVETLLRVGPDSPNQSYSNGIVARLARQRAVGDITKPSVLPVEPIPFEIVFTPA